MKRITLLFCILGISVLPLSGCMMMGMHGMQHEKPKSGMALFTELRKDDVSIILEIPSLFKGEESTLSVKVRDTESGMPLSGANVTFIIQRIDQLSVEIAERLPAEPAENGVYQLKHTFKEHGMYEITARLWFSEEEKADSPYVVTAKQEVGQKMNTMDQMRSSPMLVAGGIVMILIMMIIH